LGRSLCSRTVQKSDTQVLDQFGLLTDKAVMAHGTQLTDADFKLFHERKASLAHCPISNVYFGNSVMRVQDAQSKKR
jgi:Cytosine deaminase and related metal-dependent hydrolases